MKAAQGVLAAAGSCLLALPLSAAAGPAAGPVWAQDSAQQLA
jgi:hypothetical protein